MYDFCAMKFLMKKSIKALMSCHTGGQLDMAVKFALLAMKKYSKICGDERLASQFGLDMMYLADEIGRKIVVVRDER